MRRILMLVILLFATLPLVIAFHVPWQNGHLTLLSVVEEENNPFAEQEGSTADLYLEISPGSGRIFIDTYPWTRLETQSSTRFANRVACSYVEADCGHYDFYYTIRADSTIIGGPSAGAAIAVLTAALLEDERVNESIAITGTINSGGLIGPVAGVKPKALAAKEHGLSLVLTSGFAIPTEINQTYVRLLNETLNGTTTTNESFNLSRLYKPVNFSELGIEVREVTTLEEALAIFTGKSTAARSKPIVEDPSYTKIMSSVADELCVRRQELARELMAKSENVTEDENASTRRASATAQEDWYSLASYCFGDLIQLRTESYEGLTQIERKIIFAKLVHQLQAFEENMDNKNMSTIAELETSMIVLERIREARETLADENQSNISAAGIAYAFERINSANSWSSFFRMESRPAMMDQQRLATACVAKIGEAEERINYAELYLPENYLDEARRTLSEALVASRNGSSSYCIFAAAKAQATANLLVGSMAVPPEKIDWLVEQKLAVVEGVIRRQEARSLFPILGYSYYRYAQSLSSHDPYSALTYAEYSLELSNLDMYFPQQAKAKFPVEYFYLGMIFLSGLIFGLALSVVATRWRKTRDKKRITDKSKTKKQFLKTKTKTKKRKKVLKHKLKK